MENKNKIALLKNLLEKSNSFSERTYHNPDFKSWKNLVERTLISIYGSDSIQVSHFYGLHFTSRRISLDSRYDYEKITADLKSFESAYKMLITAINQYIEECIILNDNDNLTEHSIDTASISKIFISHATKDAKIIIELVDLLESIGLESNQIFCTSVDGYGISIGDNFLDAIRHELSDNCLVLFLLSDNFMNSAVCLCEMGATWVLSKEHIPILIPPFDYSDIKGVIPLTQGFKINESLKLNLFKEKIEQLFGLPSKLNSTTWERKRDRFINNIESHID